MDRSFSSQHIARRKTIPVRQMGAERILVLQLGSTPERVQFWRGSQVVRRGSAKPLYIGSIPIRASNMSAPASCRCNQSFGTGGWADGIGGRWCSALPAMAVFSHLAWLRAVDETSSGNSYSCFAFPQRGTQRGSRPPEHQRRGGEIGIRERLKISCPERDVWVRLPPSASISRAANIG